MTALAKILEGAKVTEAGELCTWNAVGSKRTRGLATYMLESGWCHLVKDLEQVFRSGFCS